MRGWWKMAIFHLKHSYLNWKVIPCKREMIRVYAIFHHFFFAFFDLLDSHLGLLEFFTCMTWQSFFLFFFFHFFLTHLLQVTTRAIEGLSDWSITSQYGDSFGKMVFWSKIVYIISIQKRIMAQKMVSKYHGLGICVFGHWKGFDRLEA